MTDKILPLQYHIEIYPRSFAADPIFAAQATTPFPVPNIGDHADRRSCGEGGSGDEFTSVHLVVTDVQHLWWKIEGSHVSHKLMIALSEA